MTDTTVNDKKNKERTSITMDPTLLAEVRQIALDRNQSVSQFISSAVRELLKR